MKKVLISSLILLALFTTLIISGAFTPKPLKVTYQHIFIISVNKNLDEVYVSVDGKDYQRLKLGKQSLGQFDMGPLINLAHQYENDGYKIENFTGDGEFQYMWLRKENTK